MATARPYASHAVFPHCLFLGPVLREPDAGLPPGALVRQELPALPPAHRRGNPLFPSATPMVRPAEPNHHIPLAKSGCRARQKRAWISCLVRGGGARGIGAAARRVPRRLLQTAPCGACTARRRYPLLVPSAPHQRTPRHGDGGVGPSPAPELGPVYLRDDRQVVGMDPRALGDGRLQAEARRAHDMGRSQGTGQRR